MKGPRWRPRCNHHLQQMSLPLPVDVSMSLYNVMGVGHRTARAAARTCTHQYCLLTTVGGHLLSVSMYLEHHDLTRW